MYKNLYSENLKRSEYFGDLRDNALTVLIQMIGREQCAVSESAVLFLGRGQRQVFVNAERVTRYS
jgi:hypothetical protein